MAWETLGALEGLPDGAMRRHETAAAQYVVCRMGDEVFVLEDECPHAGGPLSMGNFSPPLLVCPWHAWEFDCRSGQCVHAANASVRSYPVEIRDGAILADLPEKDGR
ncbi:MAG: Rieske 2Fe-2S domain-containing protein [Bryobacterales bacterium]|nr:Rieske 2Fe-2S domain-containing protein [Bryobacterales bacterium]